MTATSTRHRWRLLALALGSALAASSLVTGSVVPAHAAGQVTAMARVPQPGELSIDLGARTGAFLGGASGTLYGVYGENLPSRNLIEGMRLRTVSTKAQDGPQHPGADALEVARAVTAASGGDVLIYMTDIYRGFPYQVPGNTGAEKWADYKTRIAQQVDQVLTLEPEVRDHIVFVPFNEPEGNMFGSGDQSFYRVNWLDDPKQFFAAWDEAHALIRSKLPSARIAGPNTSVLFNQVRGFMEHTRTAGTLPDVVTWHELSNPAAIRNSVARYRQWERELFAGTPQAGKQLPINLNEYAHNYHTSVPGQMIQWVSALEDSKVDGDIAYWNIDGNLSDSAVQANRGNGQWWLLNAYGNMTGDTVAVKPPSPGVSYTLQGVATLDQARRQSRVLFGGSSGPQSVVLDRVPANIFGTSVHLQVREIRWTGQVGDSGAPQPIREWEAPVVDGSVALEFGAGALPALNADSAYEVIVAPGRGTTSPSQPPVTFRSTYEAEDAAWTGAPRYLNGPEGSPTNEGGFYTSNGRNVGGIKEDSTLRLNFAVTVPQTGRYDLRVFANSLNTFPANVAQGPINAFISVDGAAEQILHLPLAYKFVVWDHTSTTVDLTAGTHTITIAARSLDGTRATRGDAIIDKIEVSLPAPGSDREIYEAENATLATGARTNFEVARPSGAGVATLPAKASATFWVYSQRDAPALLAVDGLGSGSAQVSVNGVAVARATSRTTQREVFLSGGVNKVVVTGVSGRYQLDRLVVRTGRPSTGSSYEAEAATPRGPVEIRGLSLASGGQAVGSIGGGRDGRSSLTFDNVQAASDGTYALTFRYSNEEQSVATHYNPDPLARHADVAVNGVVQRVWFPHSFHQNQFWDLTVPVTLKRGTNTITITSRELPGFDGKTYLSDTFPGVLLKSQWAPNLDRITVTPFSAAP